jgi:hypothetical protein
VVEAGCYVTAGTKVTLTDGSVVKAVELSGRDGVQLWRNSVSGAVEARQRTAASRSTRRCTPTPDASSCSRRSSRLVWWSAAATCCCVRPTTCSIRQGSCEVRIGDDSVSLQPEQAQNAALIAGIGVRRRLPVRAVAVALATAYQESKIVNVDYGDRDSLGLFQQRPSQGWGTAEQVQDPVYATKAFYDALVQVDGYRRLPIHDAAQEVQRSADGSAYEQHETNARLLAKALTGRTRAALSCDVDDPDDSGQVEQPTG